MVFNIVFIGYLFVLSGHIVHILLEAGKDFNSLKSYIKVNPLSIITSFTTSTLLYLLWMIEGINLGDSFLVLPKGQPLFIWCMMLGGISNMIFIKIKERYGEGKFMNIPMPQMKKNGGT